MFANLSWSSGLIADGTGSELARAVGHPDVLSAQYDICHMRYAIWPYICIGNIITRHRSVAPQRPLWREALLRWDNGNSEVSDAPAC